MRRSRGISHVPRARILITGASGLLGRALKRRLAEADVDVIGIGHADADIADAAAISNVIRSHAPLDAVVHLAAIAHRSAATADYQRVNADGARNVFEAATEVGAKRLVFASSVAVYGIVSTGCSINERATCQPFGAYAATKYEAEQHCLRAAVAGVDAWILRFPAVYSSDRLTDVRKRAYVPLTGNRVLLHIAGDSPRYSFCSVENAADALFMAATGALRPGVYNIADPIVYRQPEVARLLSEVDGHTGPRVSLRRDKASALAWASRVVRRLPLKRIRAHYSKLIEGLVLDTSKAAAEGFKPRHTLFDLGHVERRAGTQAEVS